jgi:hypothetical protein
MRFPTRRQFLLGAGAVGAVGGAAAIDRFRRFAHTRGVPVADASPIALPSALEALTAPEYLTLAAATERVFPEDSAPGAIALGVPHYIDRWIASTPAPPWAEELQPGLLRLDKEATERFKQLFCLAGASNQDALLAEWEADHGSVNARFLQNLVEATLEGVLGDPTYGGNLNSGGWASIGLHRDPFVPTRKT